MPERGTLRAVRAIRCSTTLFLKISLHLSLPLSYPTVDIFETKQPNIEMTDHELKYFKPGKKTLPESRKACPIQKNTVFVWVVLVTVLCFDANTK